MRVSTSITSPCPATVPADRWVPAPRGITGTSNCAAVRKTAATSSAHEPADQPERLVAIAGVEVHLPAARLLLGKGHLLPEALEHLHRRLPGLREQRVVEACDEKRDPHRARV